MTTMLWVKMPSEWVSLGLLKKDFSGNNNVGEDIAALKIFLVICLLAKEVSRPTKAPPLSLPDTRKQFHRNVLECSATYDKFTEMCSLSRSLVSKGLKKLESVNLIEIEGGRRSKKYRVIGSPDRRWCKLPKRSIVHNEETIPMFLEFLNRYQHERNALKIYIYILASRTNSKNYVDLSRGIISEKTGVPVLKVDGALGFLQSIGMMEKVEKMDFLLRSNEALSEDRVHRYWVTGHEALNYKSIKYVGDDY